MRVKVQYLAALRELAGRSEESFAIEEKSTVRDLLLTIAKRHDAVSEYAFQERGVLRPGFIVLVNGRAAKLDDELQPDSLVQILPPVGGG